MQGRSGKIAWILEASSEDAEYSVYFDVVGGNYERVDYGTRAIGAGEPLICDDVVLNVGFWSTPANELLVGNHRGLLHLFRDDSTEGGRPALLPHQTIKVLRGQLSPAVLPLLRCQTGMEMRPHPWAEGPDTQLSTGTETACWTC